MRQDDLESAPAVGQVRGNRARGASALFEESIERGGLTWFPELGYGFYPVATGNAIYNRAYFDRYATNAESRIGRALMVARCNFVDRHHSAGVVDVGIGSGAFIEERARRRHGNAWTCGYDVNHVARAWLVARNIWFDPYVSPVEAITLWDVLEHIADFRPLLRNVREWCFVSIPIFDRAEHVLRAKHFRKSEHYWYFTREGLIRLFAQLGFKCVERSDMETQIGREGIESFAFRRIG